MEIRKELSLNSVLKLGETEYHIEGVAGKGSCAIMYKAWYSDDTINGVRHHVLVKELFPVDIKGGIYRNTNDKIEVLPQAQEQYALYRKSFERGNKIQLNILEMFPEKNGVNINTYSFNNTLYSILGFGGGRDLETELLVSPETNLLKATGRLIGVLRALEEFHSLGYYHLDISPDNILLIGKDEEERVVLIDYNSVLSEDELKGNCDIFYSLKKGYTAPELRSGMRNKISASTDLYSVAAVFFRTVCGRALTEFEMLRRMPPDVSECAYIKNEPETVKNLVRKLLVKGLSPLPEKRYLSAFEMRKDFEELKDRILGMGITHWSLWESSRRNIREFIRNNTSFGFLKEQEGLFTLNVCVGDEIKNTETFLNDIINGASSAVLVGDGGMGKTTSLLNVAYNVNSKYNASSTAVSYISLYKAVPKDENFIKDKLLESLRFKPDTKTFEMARYKLKQIFKEQKDTCERPVLVVLVDGLNEITGNVQLVIEEIKELSQYNGIRFVITTRQYNDEFDFEKAYLVPLKDSEVSKALSNEGLLLPQNGEFTELLRNPLMLSIFIEASKNSNKQLRLNSKKELVSEYFTQIAKKGTESTNESEGKFHLNDVAVNYVLPAIAEECRKRKKALTDEEIFKVVKRCYKVLNSKIVFRAFPKWIGHLNDILCGCKSAEIWHGMVVRDILWKKTGLLAKNESGSYRIFHQTIEEYLLDINAQNIKKVRQRIIIKNTTIVSCILVAFIAFCGALTATFPELAEKSIIARFKAVPNEKADAVLSDMTASYVNSGLTYGVASLLMKNPNDESLNRNFKYYKNSIDTESERKRVENSVKLLGDIEELGGVMPYSYEEIYVNEGEELLKKSVTDMETYSRYIELLPQAYRNENTEYISVLEEFMKADAEYTSLLFHYVTWHHTMQMDENSALRKAILDSASVIPEMESVRKRLTENEQDIDSYTVIEYKKIRQAAYNKMENIYGKYEIIYEDR